MRLYGSIVVLLFMFTSLAIGQTTQPVDRSRPPTPAEVRDRLHMGRPETSPNAGLIERVKSELKLEPSQIEQIDKLSAENDKTFAALREQMRMSPETIAEMTKLREELNKATEAGDQAKIKEAGDKIKMLRDEFTEKTKPVRERMTNMQNQFRDQVRNVLREDQREAFDRIWQDRGPGDMKSRLRQNPRMLRAQVERLPDLTPEQKSQIEAIFKQNNEAEKSLKERAARDQAAQRVYDTVMGILTPAQREQLEARGARRETRKPEAGTKVGETPPKP